VAAFLLLAAGIGALWYSAISAYETAVLREHGRELQAIAELKIDFVRFWLDERRGDAAVQAGRLTMARALVPRAGNPAADSPEDMQGQLEAIRKAYQYKAVTLLDRAGNVRLGAGSLTDFGRGATTAAARAAMAGGRVHVGPAYHPEDGGRHQVDIDIAAPVVGSRRPGAPIVGALTFHLDSRIHLDPLLRRWPAPGGSGESFLFERDGEDLIYLTSLRHAEADTLHRRADESSLPAALAATGSQGVVEGIDYRGMPVLAAVGQVPGMPWFVVAKLDREEILAPVRREALWSGTLSTLLVLALGLAMFSWRRRTQSELALAQETASREALHASEARARKLAEYAWDYQLLYGRNMRIVYASPSVTRDLGYDLVGRHIADGRATVHPEDVDKIEAARRSALSQPGLPQRVDHRLGRKNGIWMEVEACFVNHFDDPGIDALAYTARDVTQRREAEAKRLEYAHQQRDTLVREVHHRIKNHLQGLTGLLNQHRRQHPDQHDALGAVNAQISAISVIHGLQGRDASGEVRLFRLLQEIVSFLGSRAALEFGNADNTACQNCAWRVADEESVPVALVINELVTNAIKHQAGSPGGQSAPVRIDCACNVERIVVTVRNPGVLPRGFDFAAEAGLGTGLTLVRSLLAHEGAVLSIASGVDGMVETRLTLTPPVVSSKAAASPNSPVSPFAKGGTRGISRRVSACERL
jgi:PAS domain S-box-containing protein